MVDTMEARHGPYKSSGGVVVMTEEGEGRARPTLVKA